MKKQRLREKTLNDVQKSKQTTFDNLPKQKEKPTETSKKAITMQLHHTTKDEELELSISFHLLPSRMYFSTLTLELYFDDNKLNTYLIRVPPSRLLSDELEFPVTLDLHGIISGQHVIKVEMFEKGDKEEILASTSQYIIVQYSPLSREDRYVKIPIVRKIDGVFRILLSEEKELYRELEKNQHREANSKRDQW